MPFVAEHSRNYEDRGWWLVHHEWTDKLVITVSQLIEEDGGPPEAHMSGSGEYEDRPMVEHTFSRDFDLPDEEEGFKKGDRARLWLQR